MMTPTSQTPDSGQEATGSHEAELNHAAQAIRSAYSKFVERVQPSIDYYTALGRRAEVIRKVNEKLPL